MATSTIVRRNVLFILPPMCRAGGLAAVPAIRMIVLVLIIGETFVLFMTLVTKIVWDWHISLVW